MSSIVKDQTASIERDEPVRGETLDGVSGDRETIPSVSVVIPCYNEERFIAEVLANLQSQYVGERFEIIVVDGMSEDGTRAAVQSFIERHPEARVRLIDNPKRNIPLRLTSALRRRRTRLSFAWTRIPCRRRITCGAWSRCWRRARRKSSARGGASRRARRRRWVALSRSQVAHPFGIGDAKYRQENVETQYVDTVPFGVFRKELWTRLGGFNEELLANEDYDFYYRARQMGGRVLLDAEAHSTYFARPTLGALAQQYARYGGWKAQMVKLHPRSIRLRQVVAPAFVCALAGFGLLGLLWRPAWAALLLVIVAYASLAVWFGFKASKKRGESSLTPLVAFVFFVIHITWGSSFLRGLVRPPG
jgi:GT2 family glycosyltransferase